jgi:hypothetical protein
MDDLNNNDFNSNTFKEPSLSENQEIPSANQEIPSKNATNIKTSSWTTEHKWLIGLLVTFLIIGIALGVGLGIGLNKGGGGGGGVTISANESVTPLPITINFEKSQEITPPVLEGFGKFQVFFWNDDWDFDGKKGFGVGALYALNFSADVDTPTMYLYTLIRDDSNTIIVTNKSFASFNANDGTSIKTVVSSGSLTDDYYFACAADSLSGYGSIYIYKVQNRVGEPKQTNKIEAPVANYMNGIWFQMLNKQLYLGFSGTDLSNYENPIIFYKPPKNVETFTWTVDDELGFLDLLPPTPDNQISSWGGGDYVIGPSGSIYMYTDGIFNVQPKKITPGIIGALQNDMLIFAEGSLFADIDIYKPVAGDFIQKSEFSLSSTDRRSSVENTMSIGLTENASIVGVSWRDKDSSDPAIVATTIMYLDKFSGQIIGNQTIPDWKRNVTFLGKIIWPYTTIMPAYKNVDGLTYSIILNKQTNPEVWSWSTEDFIQ